MKQLLNKENKYGETPLFNVSGSGNIDFVEFLIEQLEEIIQGN